MLTFARRAGAMLFVFFGLLAPAGGKANPVQIAGPAAPQYQTIDRAVRSFMQAQGVHNAQFAISEKGRVVFSHAYTNGAAPATPETVFRLASNSKAWTSAAVETVLRRGFISRNTRAFQFLGITQPLPLGTPVDPRVFAITVGNLIDHKSGWDDGVAPYFDPTHSMRQIALELHRRFGINRLAMVRYMLGKPLQEPPGTKYAYCNFCYVVLGMIVERAARLPFEIYLERAVAFPLGVRNLVLSPTLEPRLRIEVAHYYSPYEGLSPIFTLSSRRFPDPNGGDGLIREVDGPAGGLATNALSMLRLMDRYLIWGVGPPQPGVDWAREGSDEGTDTWAEQRADGKHWSFLVNTRDFTTKNAFGDFTKQINKLLDALP
jgi:CubicO group peptidase (beta-lactamase class C family)